MIELTNEEVRPQHTDIASFSPCRSYRYTLWRTWGRSLTDKPGYVNFICLNPSTADETTDDNTIRKCVKFAKSWGYSAMCVTNIFAWRDTDPKAMKQVADPVGEKNDWYIKHIADGAELIVVAWGQHGTHLNRSSEVLQMMSKPLNYLRMGKNNQPWHPLYLPDASMPIEWRSR